jgi:hypothetical protein
MGFEETPHGNLATRSLRELKEKEKTADINNMTKFDKALAKSDEDFRRLCGFHKKTMAEMCNRKP